MAFMALYCSTQEAAMKITAPFLVTITLLNAAFALVSISQSQSAWAAPEVAQVLRGRKLEIVDDKSRVRASVTVHPAGKAPDGSPHEESTVLRLINADGKPGVKIASSHTTAGISLVAEQGNFLTISSNGMKLTKGGTASAAWP
jgi:hypothetical protein